MTKLFLTDRYKFGYMVPIIMMSDEVMCDEQHNILMVYYLAGVGGTGCTPTNRVLGW